MEKNEGLALALCGAKSKRTGKKCRQLAMKNGRCRLHGGKSTGPRTQKGIYNIRVKNLKHGVFSKTSKKEFEDMMTIYSHFRSFNKNIRNFLKN